jgi:hypothetical protein
VGQIQIVPANDAAFYQAIADFRDLLFFLFRVGKLTWIANGHGSGKAVGQFDLVQLFFDGLAQGEVVDLAQDE